MEVRRDQLLASSPPDSAVTPTRPRWSWRSPGARLGLELARRERERLEGLFAQQAVPERRVIEARSTESLAKEENDAASRRLAQHRGTQRATGEGASGRVELESPVTGVVAAVSAAPGAFIEEGRELFRVVNLDRLWLEVQVPEADIGRIGKPTGAWFEVDGVDRSSRSAPGRAGGWSRSAGSSTPSRALRR